MLDSKTSVAALSVGSNLTLTVAKLTVGLLIGSVSVVAEAIHSGVDLLASIIAYLAVRTSSRPADDRYPYGRGKFENVSGTVEALLIFLAAGLIAYEAIRKLAHGTTLPQADLGVAMMGVSVIANTLVSRQLFRVARKTDSVALEADAYHLTTDIATSLGVFAGLVAVRLTGLAILDPIAALGVAVLIVKAAWDITRRSFVDLLDQSLPEEERGLIASVLEKHSGQLCGYHRIRTRKAGPDRHVDLHLVVEAALPVGTAHALCDQLEQDLHEALGPCSVNIHVEPCRRDCHGGEATCRVEHLTR